MTTIKQQKIAKEVVNGMVGESTETAQKMLENVGYSKAIARHPARILKSKGVHEEVEKIKETILEAFERKGISPAKVADKVASLLDAQKTVRVYKHGEFEFEMVRVDYAAISKGIDYALKVGIGGGYEQVNSNFRPIPLLGGDSIRNSCEGKTISIYGGISKESYLVPPIDLVE